MSQASKTVPVCVLKRPNAEGHHCQSNDMTACDSRGKKKQHRGTAYITFCHTDATTVRLRQEVSQSHREAGLFIVGLFSQIL